MKAKKKTKVLLLLYLNLALVTVTAASLVYTTFAWFVTTRNASVEFQSITVAVEGFKITKVSRYPVKDIAISGTTHNYTILNDETNEIPIYDPENIYYSPYKRAVVVHVRFDYEGVVPVNFYGKTANSFTIGISTGPNVEFDKNYTSNSFQFTSANGPVLTGAWSEQLVTYNSTNTKKFVVPAFDPIEPSKVIGATKNQEIIIKQIQPGESELWYVVEYYEPIMDYIGRTYISNKIIKYEDDILFSVDE